MKRKRRKLPARMVVIWDQRETARLVEACERLHSLILDLTVLLAEPKRRAEAAAATRRLRAEAAGAEAAQCVLNGGQPQN